MKVKEFSSAFSDSTRFLVIVTVKDLKLEVFNGVITDDAYVEVEMSKEKLLENISNFDVETVEQIVDGNNAKIKIQTSKPIYGNLVEEKPESEITESETTESEIPVEDQTFEEEDESYESLYNGFVEERNRLRQLKKAGKLDQENLTWLSEVREAIRSYEETKESGGDLENWYNKYKDNISIS